jgi:hypothetical protein
MASRIRSIDFLPEIFQTPTNAQFLGATVDQLISQPTLAPLQGYIGQRFGPGINPKDTYIPEPSKARTDYQLEPGVIFLKPDTNTVDDFLTYPGIIDAINVEGGITTNPQELFSNQFYSWDPFVDLDKLINYSQYYWLPNGPIPVTLTTNVLYGDQKYVVSSTPQGYLFDGDNDLNPAITLIRGATYEFDVDQQSQFWIQGEPGVSGVDPIAPNVSTREILGVVNNGTTKGKVLFTVPPKDAQDFLANLPGDYSVDLATDLTYLDFLEGYNSIAIANITQATPGVVTTVTQHGLYDGASVIFEFVGGMTEINGNRYYAKVLSTTTFQLFNDYELTTPINTSLFTSYSSGGNISIPNWKTLEQIGNIDGVTSFQNKTLLVWKGTFNEGVYRVIFVNSPTVPFSTDPYGTTGWDQQTLVTLVPVPVPPPNLFRIVVQGGNVYALRTFYKQINNNINLIPYISANKDILYYQDSVFPNNFGVIQLVDDNSSYKIDVVADILGKQQARVPQSDPNGITLTNGLKVKFQGNVVPASYLEGEYYVEGVGTSIELIPVGLLDVTNEPFLIEDTLFQADYITINRGSKDLNAWTRSNRWFHSNVIQIAEQANNTFDVAPGYNIKDQRAKRPIIEFRAGLKLFNQGIIGVNPVNWVDTTTLDALSTVSGQPFSSYHPDGSTSELSVGDTIIFIADTTGSASTQFYVGELNGNIILESIYTYQINEQSYVTNGTRAGNTYWYDGTGVSLWNLGQRKQVVNQEPLFDVFNSSGVSFSTTATYPNTTFSGNKLFSFARGTGPADPIIGFPLQYNGVGNLGDITFDVNLYSATFTYTSGTTTVTEKVSNGFVYDYTSLVNFTRLLGWQTAIEDSVQYQVFTFNTAATDYNFNLTSTRFICDIPAVSDSATQWLNCAVYVESILQDVNSYTVSINPTALVKGTNTGAIAVNGGIGYEPNSTLTLSFNTPEGGNPAQGIAITDANGTITSINITDGGFGYTFDSSGVNAVNTIPLVTAVSGKTPIDSATFTFTLASPLSLTTLITLNSQVVETSVVNILLYSESVSENAYFEIPSNLANNPLSSNVTSIASGDIRLQYQSIYRNLPAASGPVFGNNNLHDLGNIIPYGTNIIQNSAPLTLPSVFLRNSNHNIFAALKYNSNEYQKFKDLIIDNANRGNYTNLMTPGQILDDIIQTIGNTRNQRSPFYWSDMVPSGAPIATRTYNFNTTTAITRFQLTRRYNFTAANYLGLQVYHIRTVNGITVQTTLIRGRDYQVSTTAASVTVTYPIIPGDQIQIDEYNQTFGSYCPSTPTKLGMYPKYIPEVVYDETYQPATYFIRGHDNSYNRLYGNYDPITKTLDDPRDSATLEFEQRIYNNIKLPLSYDQVDSLPVPLTSVIPGKFRQTGYTREQIININTSQFLNWVGQNRIDYRSQEYQPANYYSYNYNQSTDRLDNELIPPGYWRGVYNYFYDTDHPATAPWEMLGFTTRPSWWLGRYGDAPYTSDNTLLWNDLAQGINWNDGNPVVLPARVRPGLLDILPVNSKGEMLPPIESVVGQSDYFTFKNNWVYGDQAPAETAYIRSSQWPFDAIRLLALTKPAEFFNFYVNVDTYRYNAEFNQYLYNGRYRLAPENVPPIYATIPLGFPVGSFAVGSSPVGSPVSTTSYINWIVDYELQLGIQASTEITSILNNLDVRLVYRLAGFSSKDKLAFYVGKSTPASTNNSLLIPDDSYQIILYNNQPFDKIFYSSVIIQKVEGGFAVFGNGQVETYFNSVEPIFNGQYATFTQSGLTVTVSTAYNPKTVIQTPYGFVFTNPQAVAEFLTNYGRYLEQQGVRFEQTEGTAKINWEYMIYEFLYWVASGWSIGSTINLNPSAKLFTVNKDSAIIQPLTIQQQNFVLNQNLLPIQNKDMSIVRDGTVFAVTPLNEGDTVAYTNLNVSNMEHAIIFDNKTVFNDVIYSLVTGLRQQRILLRGYKTGEWQGSVNPDGFILNRDNIEQWNPNRKYTKGVIVKYKNRYWVSNQLVPPSTTFDKDKWFASDFTQVQEGLLSNPATRSAESVLYYDINNANLDQDSSLLSYSLIGFRPREYLVAANLPDSSQVNVYKNMIETKGTSLSLNVFKKAQLPQSTIDYTTYENWAILGGQFGGVLNQNYVEMDLNEALLSGNPATIGMVNIRISGITKASIAVVTTTTTHGLFDGQELTITGVLGMLQVNGNTYYAKTIGYSSTQFGLYTNAALSVPVNSTEYTTYISGGYVNPKLNGVQQTVQLNELVNYGRKPLTANFLPTIAINSYNADSALPAAGYANFNDVKYSAYNVASLAANANGVTALNKGNYIWIADVNGTWQMYTTVSTNTTAILVVNNLDGTVTIYFNGSHQLTQNTTIAVVDFDSQVNGYYSVLNVLSDSTIQITLNLDPSVQQIESQGVVLKLVSQRVATPADILNLNLLNTEFLRNRVWVDEDIDTDWAVYEKTINYTSSTTLSDITSPTTSAAYTTALGYAIALSSAGEIQRYTTVSGELTLTETLNVAIGAAKQIVASQYNSGSTNSVILVVSNEGTNQAQVFANTGENGALVSITNLTSPDSDTVQFGKHVAISGDANFIAVADGNNTVYIFEAVADFSNYVFVADSQITVGSSSTDLFGYNMSLNYDGSRLIITAPQSTVDGKIESGSVYVFDKLGTDTTYTLSQTITQPTGEGYEASDAGAEFGRGQANNVTISELLIGAPYALNQVDGSFVDGAVYRYTDIGKKTGVVQGILTNAVNGTIYINGIPVPIFASTASAIANIINTNATSIPNVMASGAVNPLGQQVITISLIDQVNAQVNNKLTVTGDSEVLAQIGIMPYLLTQTIYDPHLENVSQFGYTIAYSEQDSFITTAPAGNQYALTLFDYTDDATENDTIFDHDTTQFVDQNINAGVVYMFDYLGVANPSLENPGKYVYAQSNNPTFSGTSGQAIKQSAAEGSALLFRNFSTISGLQNGAILFVNTKQQTDWHTYRKSQAIVDAALILNVQLYDRLSNETLAYIDTIDPLGGKILGIVEENIDYIGFTDPAAYDVTINSNASSLLWGEAHVGRIWVDTSNARWVNYHQNDTDYNSIHFATVFPGSVVSAYTWTESLVTPDEWPGPGLPFSTINYSFQYVEDSTGGLSPRYYFWVSDSNTVYTQLGKTLNAKTVAQYIQDPLNSGVSYMGALNASTVALYNSGNDINDQSSVLHIGLTVSEINDDLHQQFDLIREDSTFDFLPGFPSVLNDFAPPANLYSKFLDSLCGRDELGQLVPDPDLPPLVRTGTARRPRQTMFRDPFVALQNYITYANEVLYTIPAAENKAPSFLNKSGTAAESRTGRAFNTANFWTYATWWAAGYDRNLKIVETVGRFYQLQTIQPYEGLVVRVANNGEGAFEVYIYENSAWRRIGLQFGTFVISPSIYAVTTPENMPSDAIYWILRGLNEQIFTEAELIFRNKLLILMFQLIASEGNQGQNYLPWLNKTSFLDVDHRLRELTENEKFQRDNEFFLEGYLNETKPFHVVIKDFALVYNKTDPYFGDITDFDVPAQYNSSLAQFYSPQLQYNYDIPLQFNQYYPNDPIWQTADYTQWFQNYGVGLLPNGLPDFPATQVTQFITLPVNTFSAQIYGQPTASIRVDDPAALRVNQFITSDSGALALNTQITAIDFTTGVLSLNKATLTSLTTTDNLTVYDPISVENAYSLMGSGVIRIGEEKIAYQTVDRAAGIITDLIRGYENTVATTHLAGVEVRQDLPAVQVYDGARGYSLTRPPRISAYIDTTIYPAPRQTVLLNPNINSDGTITSVDIVNPGAGYVIQPLIEVEPPSDPAFTQYFALNDIIYDDNLRSGTNRNTISMIVPIEGAVNVPTVADSVTSSILVPILNAEGITVGMGVLYNSDPTPRFIPSNTTVIEIIAATDISPVFVKLNVAVTLPQGATLTFVHQFKTGDPVRFKALAGTKPPLGLLDDSYYYVGAVGGIVTGVNVISAGSGYVDIPTIRILGGGGIGAVAVAAMAVNAENSSAISITNGASGVGYNELDLVSISVTNVEDPAILQVLTVNGGAITSVAVYRVGSTTYAGSYVNLPNPVAVLTNVSTGIYDLVLTNPGAEYIQIPTIQILGGGATAIATAHVASMYLSLAIVNGGGSGYALNDVLTINSGAGTAARLTVTGLGAGNSVTAATITVSGSYSTLPPVTGATTTVSPPGGTGATFNLRFSVEDIVIDDIGAGYSSTPIVQFSESTGTGTGAAADVIMPNGATVSVTDYSVADIEIVANQLDPTMPTGGIDYTTVPNISISGGGGSGAAGIAIIDNDKPQSRIALYKNRSDALNNLNRIQLANDGRSSNLKDYRLAVTAIIGSLFGGESVREITTTLGFDRTSFTSNITTWQPNNWYAGIFEDVQRLASTPISASTGLETNLHVAASRGDTSLVLSNRSGHVSSSVFVPPQGGDIFGTVTAIFVTGVTTNLSSAAIVTNVIEVNTVVDVYAGMNVSIGSDPTPGFDNSYIKVVSIDVPNRLVTIDQVVTATAGQKIEFTDYDVQNVSVNDYLEYDADPTLSKQVISVNNIQQNITTIVYQDTAKPSDGALLSFTPNILNLVQNYPAIIDIPIRIADLLITGYGIQDNTHLTPDYSYDTNPGYLTIEFDNYVTTDLDTATSIKISTISNILGNTLVASDAGVVLAITSVTAATTIAPVTITFDWLNASDLSAPLRIAPGQVNGQRVGFYRLGQYNESPIYYYLKCVNQLNSLPVNSTKVELYFNQDLTQPVTSFNFAQNDVALINVPVAFNRSLVSFQGKVYECVVSNNDASFEIDNWVVVGSNSRKLNALDRIVAFYKPTVNMPNSTNTLMTGLTYPNSVFQGVQLSGDSSFGGSTVYVIPQRNITGITRDVPARVTTQEEHNLKDRDLVTIYDINGMNEISGKSYFVKLILTPITTPTAPNPTATNAFSFDLYLDINLGIPLDTIDFTPYISGGLVVANLDYAFNYLTLTGESSAPNPSNESWDAGGWAYTSPNATALKSLDTLLQAPPMSQITDTTYNVVGGIFDEGYAPEEMVAGNVTDDVTIYVKTRPGASWDPLTVFPPATDKVDHTGYKVITLVYDTTIDGTTYSFDNVTANPLTVDVFISVQSIVKGANKQELIRAYNNGDFLNPIDPSYPYTFSVDWQTKTVTIFNFGSSLVDAFPANTEVQVSINEIGGGNELIRTSSEYIPFAVGTAMPNSVLELDVTYYDPQSPASSFAPGSAPTDPYIPPVVYNNGNRILYRGLVSTTTYNPIIGSINKIVVTNGGSGYTTAPVINVISVGTGGSYASARAIVKNGSVVAVIVTNSGGGYSSAPIIEIANPPNYPSSGTVATAIAYTATPAIIVTDGGRLYDPTPGATTVTFDVPRISYPDGEAIPGGRAATGIVNVSPVDPISAAGGVITSISITDPGYGYQAGDIEGFDILDGGSGYNYAPTIRLVGPGGSGAVVAATLTGTVLSVTVGNGGSGYVTAPIVVFTGGGGVGAAGTAVLGSGSTAGQVVSVTVTNSGSGYTHAPQVVFNNAGTSGNFATATSAITGSVNGITILSRGSGYTGAPIVVFENEGTGGGGAIAVTLMTGLPSVDNGGMVIGQPMSPTPAAAKAKATATRASNYTDTSYIVRSINVMNSGSGYLTAPIVTVIAAENPEIAGGVVATAVLGDGINGPIDSVVRIDVINTGSGFTSAPIVRMTAPDLITGTQAMAQITLDNMLNIIDLTYKFGSINNQATVQFNRTIDIANEYLSLVVFGPTVASSGVVDLNSYSITETQFFKSRAGQTSFALKNYALQDNPSNAIVELNGRRVPEVFYRVSTQIADGQRYGYTPPIPLPEIANLNDIWYQDATGYIAVGDYGVITTSVGAPVWDWESQIAIDAIRAFNSVTANYDDTTDTYKFTVAVGDGGQIYYNPDPFVVEPTPYPWLPALDFPFSSDLINVSYDKVNEQFMALGAVDTVYSTNGDVTAVSAYGFSAVITAGLVTVINMQDSGTGYVTPPTVEILGGGGTGATAIAQLGGTAVIAVKITNPGSGYTSAPIVQFSGGGGFGADAIAVVSTGTGMRWYGGIAPTLGWDEASGGWDAPVDWDTTTPVFASAAHRSLTGSGIENMSIIACADGSVLLSQNPYDLNDSVFTIIMQAGGSGYSATPNVAIVGGGGVGADAEAVVSGGVIIGINITSAGVNYSSNPTVIISDTTGQGAAAFASIESRVWVYISSLSTGVTTDFTSIAYDETDDYFMLAGTEGTLVRLTPGTSSVNKTIATVNTGNSFTVASVTGLTVGSRITGGDIPAELYCYVAAIDAGTNTINITRNPTTIDGTWTLTVGDVLAIGNTLEFTEEYSGVVRDFKKIIWTDIYGAGVNEWAAIGYEGEMVSRGANPGLTTWTIAPLPDMSSNSITWDADNSVYGISGNFGYVWTYDNIATLTVVREFDPAAQLQVFVNGNEQTYGTDWLLNFTEVFYNALFDGEFAPYYGYFNTIPFDPESVWVVFSKSSLPPKNAIIKMIYTSNIPTYRIVGQTMTMYEQLRADDAVGVTTFNYTNQQSLETDYFGNEAVSGIISINKFVTPAIIVTGTGTIIEGTALNYPGENYDSLSGVGGDILSAVVTSSVGGTGAELNAILNTTGSVKEIINLVGGSGYLDPPIVLFDAPSEPDGTLAEGIAIISGAGVVTEIQITIPGSGYTTVPAITFDNTGTGGSSASAECTLGYSIDLTYNDVATGFVNGLQLVNGGQGYTPSTTTVTWADGGTPTEEATVNWNISGDELNFVNGAHVRIDGCVGTESLNSSHTTTTATSGSVTLITIDNPGSGYVSAPTVTFTAPQNQGGVTATGTAIISGGEVVDVRINIAGSGYTVPPLIIFDNTGTSGSGANAISSINNIGKTTNFNDGYYVENLTPYSVALYYNAAKTQPVSGPGLEPYSGGGYIWNYGAFVLDQPSWDLTNTDRLWVTVDGARVMPDHLRIYQFGSNQNEIGILESFDTTADVISTSMTPYSTPGQMNFSMQLKTDIDSLYNLSVIAIELVTPGSFDWGTDPNLINVEIENPDLFGGIAPTLQVVLGDPNDVLVRYTIQGINIIVGGVNKQSTGYTFVPKLRITGPGTVAPQFRVIMQQDPTVLGIVRRANPDSSTWLTQPLTDIDELIYVQNAERLVEIYYLDDVVETHTYTNKYTGTSQTVYGIKLPATDYNQFNGAVITDETTGEALIADDYTLTAVGTNWYIAFPDSSRNGDIIKGTLNIGNMLRIGSEDIKFGSIDLVNNTVGNLTRGYDATIPGLYYPLHTVVNSMLPKNVMPVQYYTEAWNEDYWGPVQASETPPAIFLKRDIL